MILRESQNQTLGIPHAERRQLAGALAAHVGNHQFETLSSSLRFAARSIDRSFVEDAESPVDVSQLDRSALLELWERSSRQTADEDAYAGLLLAVHGFWNSINAGASQQPQWQDDPGRVRFDLNRFQHTMIELLESLRQRCGLRIDRPLKYGLSENTRDPRERRLRCDFEWLQLLDKVSEALCRGRLPTSELTARQRGSAKPVTFTLDLSEPRALLRPWPFNRARIELSLSARSFAHSCGRADEVVATAHQVFAIELRPLTI